LEWTRKVFKYLLDNQDHNLYKPDYKGELMWAVFLAFVASRAYIPSVGILDTSAETFEIWAKPEQALAFRGFTGHSGKIFSQKTLQILSQP